MENNYVGYLFCYFTGNEESLEDEQVYFAISRDGLHWTDLNGSLPVLKSTIGTKGVRDPFILRVEDQNKYVIVATDLHIAAGMSWNQAVYQGSTNIVCWESKDLLNWSDPYFYETGMKNAGCVWAPEIIYDKENKKYMMFWSSMTEKEGRQKHRIYGCYTKDFHKFSTPFLYMEKEGDIIDTTMMWHEGMYYRFSKEENSGKIIMEKGTTLVSKEYAPVKSTLLETLVGVEGPAIFRFNNENKWCLLLDRFREKKGYRPFVTKDLESGVFEEVSENTYDFGENKKRHGSVMKLTEEEWNNLETWM